MAPSILKEFDLATDMHTFLSIFWYDRSWYEKFLTEKLLDLSVEISDWTEQKDCKSRTVSSYHPSKVSFPGLPSHAEVLDSNFVCRQLHKHFCF